MALVEAGWLVLLRTLPLVINVLGAGPADLVKTAVLRSLVWAMLAAWLFGWIARIGTRRASPVGWRHNVYRELRTALAKATLLLGGVYLLATLFSIHPRISWWGTYQRAQGMYTFVSYLLLFFLIHGCLQHFSQIRRLLSVVVFGSVPVAVYGVLQRLRLDPILREAMPVLQGRVASTLGNPIFLGDYLAMVIPITLYLLWSAAHASRASSTQLWRRISLYGFLLLLQEGTLFLTQSRGPFFAHLISLFFGALLWAAMHRQRRLLALVVGTGLLALVLIGMANLPQTSIGLLRSAAQRVRLVRVMDLTERDAVWASVVSLLGAEPERIATGYGPESTAVVLLPHLTLEAARYASATGGHWDRAHNATFEALVTAGILGLIAYLLLFGAFFYTGLRELGLITTPRQKRAFGGCMSLGVVAGSFIPWAVSGSWLWLGLGVPTGMLAGVGLYAAIAAIMGSGWVPDVREAEHLNLVLALLSAVIAYFMATQVGIPTTTDWVLFWTYAALLSSLHAISVDAVQGTANGISASFRFVLQAPGVELQVKTRDLWPPLLVAVALGTLGFNFLWIPNTPLVGSSSGLLGVFVLTWLLGGGLFLQPDSKDASKWLGMMPWVGYSVVSLGWFGLFCGMRAEGIALLGHEFDFHIYMLWLIFSWLLLGAALQVGEASSLTLHRWLSLVYAVVFVAAVTVIVLVNAQSVQADIYAGSARAYASQDRWADSILLYQKAVALQPMNDIYQFLLAEAYARYAEKAPGTQQATWFQRALEAAHRAWGLNPGQMFHAANLAHVYLLWAQSTEAPEVRARALQEAKALYEEASRVLWYDARLYREWGLVLQLQGDADSALEKYRRAMALDPQEAETYRLMGYLYEELGKLDAAEKALRRAAKLNPRSQELHTALGEIYFKQGRLEEALSEAQQAIKLAPRDYQLYLNLALIYRKLGEPSQAIATIEQALPYAPAKRREELQRLIDELKAEEDGR